MAEVSAGEAIASATFGIEVYELPDFAGVLADRLEIPILDEHGGEALLVLDLHAVEDASV